MSRGPVEVLKQAGTLSAGLRLGPPGVEYASKRPFLMAATRDAHAIHTQAHQPRYMVVTALHAAPDGTAPYSSRQFKRDDEAPFQRYAS